ncbi:hypothetical protein ACKKBF_B37585 [Auxenochlorella protothecoides x Auxenochlorella symbiontica]
MASAGEGLCPYDVALVALLTCALRQDPEADPAPPEEEAGDALPRFIHAELLEDWPGPGRSIAALAERIKACLEGDLRLRDSAYPQDVLDWLGGTLSAMQTADDLTSLFATAAALAAGHATPRPAPEPNSALGLFLRRAGALFGRMPFEAVCDLLEEVQLAVHHAVSGTAPASTPVPAAVDLGILRARLESHALASCGREESGAVPDAPLGPPLADLAAHLAALRTGDFPAARDALHRYHDRSGGGAGAPSHLLQRGPLALAQAHARAGHAARARRGLEEVVRAAQAGGAHATLAHALGALADVAGLARGRGAGEEDAATPCPARDLAAQLDRVFRRAQALAEPSLAVASRLARARLDSEAGLEAGDVAVVKAQDTAADAARLAACVRLEAAVPPAPPHAARVSDGVSGEPGPTAASAAALATVQGLSDLFLGTGSVLGEGGGDDTGWPPGGAPRHAAGTTAALAARSQLLPAAAWERAGAPRLAQLRCLLALRDAAAGDAERVEALLLLADSQAGVAGPAQGLRLLDATLGGAGEGRGDVCDAPKGKREEGRVAMDGMCEVGGGWLNDEGEVAIGRVDIPSSLSAAVRSRVAAARACLEGRRALAVGDAWLARHWAGRLAALAGPGAAALRADLDLQAGELATAAAALRCEHDGAERGAQALHAAALSCERALPAARALLLGAAARGEGGDAAGAMPAALAALGSAARCAADPLAARARLVLARILCHLGEARAAQRQLDAALPVVLAAESRALAGEAHLTQAECWLAAEDGMDLATEARARVRASLEAARLEFQAAGEAWNLDHVDEVLASLAQGP